MQFGIQIIMQNLIQTLCPGFDKLDALPGGAAVEPF